MSSNSSIRIKVKHSQKSRPSSSENDKFKISFTNGKNSWFGVVPSNLKSSMPSKKVHPGVKLIENCKKNRLSKNN